MEHLNAEPTKDFFIEFLTKDISLDKAIIDLVDNSIDAAKNHLDCEGLDYDYSGYEIEMTVNKDRFVISDNCGGFTEEDARNYAFRFGRPDGAPTFGRNSIGRFGVGMKRALFKMGKRIYVESRTSNGDHFALDIEVDRWRDKTKTIKDEEGNDLEVTDWSFDFENANLTECRLDNDLYGTYIEVTELRDEIKIDFADPVYRKKLRHEIEKTLAYSLKRNISIRLNSSNLEPNPVLFLGSDTIKPYHLNRVYGQVMVDIYAGVGEPKPDDAGWYIYCNDRLMISANKENLTGWQGGKHYFNDTGVQKYHNKVAMFRGTVFFTSSESDKLPMTTTKTGIDANSQVYKSTREFMIEAMKIVLNKLNEIEDSKSRKDIVDQCSQIDVKEFRTTDLTNSFQFPDLDADDQGDTLKTIRYQVEEDVLDEVKRHTGLSKNGDVGLTTFEYYLKMHEISVDYGE